MKGKKMGKGLIVVLVVAGVAVVAVAVILLVRYFAPPVQFDPNDIQSGEMANAKQPGFSMENKAEPGEIIIENPDGYYGQQLESLKSMEPGVNYEEHTVLYQTDSRDEAQSIADIVGGELINFGDGLAVIHISRTVVSLFMELDQRNETGFEVSLNYIYSIN